MFKDFFKCIIYLSHENFKGENPYDNLARFFKSILIILKRIHDFRNKIKPYLIETRKVLSLND